MQLSTADVMGVSEVLLCPYRYLVGMLKTDNLLSGYPFTG